jgi:hypothetical protein
MPAVVLRKAAYVATTGVATGSSIAIAIVGQSQTARGEPTSKVAQAAAAVAARATASAA